MNAPCSWAFPGLWATRKPKRPSPVLIFIGFGLASDPQLHNNFTTDIRRYFCFSVDPVCNNSK